jgi:hypothetical protein
MKIINAPFLHCDTIEEYREVFIRELVKKKLKFQGYRLVVYDQDFEHACFERGEGDVEKAKFGIRRARRLLLIKSLCEDVFPYTLIYQDQRQNPSLCILSEELETAIYLAPIVVGRKKYFKLITLIVFGDSVRRRVEKQLSEGRIIEDVREVF